MAESARPSPDISQVDIIMGEIFQYLNGQDLQSCVQAFDYWERDIETERQTRQDVYPFLWTWWCYVHGKMHHCHDAQEYLRSIDDDIRGEVENYSSRRCVPLLFCTPRVVRDAEILFSDIQPTVITDEYRRLSNSENVEDRTSDEVQRVTYELMQHVIKALRRYFPCSPEIILATETDILGYSEDLTVRKLSVRHGIAGFIIPQYTGFEILNFEIPTYNDFSSIPVDANIKGLLVLSDGNDTFNRVLRLVHTRRLYEIAIGGCRSLAPRVARNGWIVAFCGESVEIASLVVSPYDVRAKRKLSLFQETKLLRNKCFAFVFNCCEVEGKFEHNLPEMFTKLYPNIPLAGLSTAVIYGVDYLPGVSEEIKTLYLGNLLIRDRSEYGYGNKSVFVLVSIKP